MAENTTIRNKFFNSLANGAKWDVGVSINRTNPLPLDQYSVFKSETDLDAYIKGAFAYPGQIVAVVDETETKIYYLAENKIETKNDEGVVIKTEYELIKAEVGSMPGVDKNSIIIETDEKTGDEYLTLVGLENASAGASLIKGADGKIDWVDISGGFSADLTAINAKTSNLNTVVFGNSLGNIGENNIPKYDINEYVKKDNSLIDQVEALKEKFASMGEIFNFVGSFTSDEFSNKKAESYDIGDVVLVDGQKEYLCVEKTRSEYVTSEDVEAIPDKTYYIKDDEGKYVKIEEVITESPAGSGYYEIKTITEKVWEPFGDPDGIADLKKTVETHTANFTNLNLALSKKAEKEYVDTELDKKVDVTEYATRFDEVESKLSAKAENIDLINGLAGKADKALTETVLALKADKTYVDTQLNTKVDTTEYAERFNEFESKLSAKAENVDLINGLTLKADKSTTETAFNSLGTRLTTAEGDIDKLETTVAQNTRDILSNIGTLRTYGTDIAGLKSDLGSITDEATASTAFGKAAEAKVLATTAQTQAQLGITNAAAAQSAAGVADSKAVAAQNRADEAYALAETKVDSGTYSSDITSINTSLISHNTAIGQINTKIGTLGNVMNFVGELSGTEDADGNITITGMKSNPDKEPEHGDVGYYKNFEYVYIVTTSGEGESVVTTKTWEKFGDTSAEAGRISVLEQLVGKEETYKKDENDNDVIDTQPTGLFKDVFDLQNADKDIRQSIALVDTYFKKALAWGSF